jgi:hypothetical protein
MPIRTPRSKRQAENYQNQAQKRFLGMYKDLPASEVPQNYSALNRNCNDYGLYSEGRTGSRLYTEADKPVGTLNGRCDHLKAKKVIKIYGSKVYICNKDMGNYVEVQNLSGVTLTGKCTIVEYNNDALVFCTAGLLLLVMNDPDYGSSFYYLRRMDEDLPDTLVTDIPETVSAKYGYRYIYSLMQKSGNQVHSPTKGWDRLTEGYPPIFESATTKASEKGKDYGEVFFQYPCGNDASWAYSPFMGNISGNYTVPAGVYDVTHFGIYRTKNIGKNTTPPGIDPIKGIGNNSELYVWVADIPVAKALYGSVAAGAVYGILTSTQGFFYPEDLGSVVTFANGSSAQITGYIDNRNVYVSINTPITAQACAIGGGRIFTGYQDGLYVFNDASNFVPGDVGKPIFWMNGKISWISEYIGPYKVKCKYSQSINCIAATIAPLSGNFTRYFNDRIKDDGVSGDDDIGLKERAMSAQPIYFPRRFYTAIPSGDIGCVDHGFIVTATRDDTTFYYTDIGAKKYTCGYYRADHQREKVETHIRQILSVGSVITIFMKSKTRTLNPGVAADQGNPDVGESIFVIPPSFKCDDAVGVIAWQSIAFKGNGLIFAITNEPAMRSFDGKGWSSVNYAQDQVQKDLMLMDPEQKVVSVYLPGKNGGYKIWFKKWVNS